MVGGPLEKGGEVGDGQAIEGAIGVLAGAGVEVLDGIAGGAEVLGLKGINARAQRRKGAEGVSKNCK